LQAMDRRAVFSGITGPLVAVLVASLAGDVLFAETEWRIGLASVRITPEGPIPMCGYSPNLSEGVLDDLYAKALAIEHRDGARAVLVTADLLFFRAPLAQVLCREIMEKTSLERRQILLNASHTHAGPVFGIKDPDRFDLPDDQRRRVDAYTEKLRGQLVDLVGRALDDLKPGGLSWGVGKADFVMNRRLMTPEWQPLTEEDPPYSPAGEYALIEADPGDVIFFDSYVPHGSPANTSDRSRRNVYVTFNRRSAGFAQRLSLDHAELLKREAAGIVTKDEEVRRPGRGDIAHDHARRFFHAGHGRNVGDRLLVHPAHGDVV